MPASAQRIPINLHARTLVGILYQDKRFVMHHLAVPLDSRQLLTLISFLVQFLDTKISYAHSMKPRSSRASMSQVRPSTRYSKPRPL